MNSMQTLFDSQPVVINAGLREFADNLRDRGYGALHVEWKPPAGGDEKLYSLLRSLKPLSEQIDAANREAVDRILAADPVLTGIRTAGDVVPGLTGKTIFHAGPPISWERMCGPLKGAVIGAILFEGWASDVAEAERLASSGDVKFDSCHHHDAVGPMTGVLPPSMPVFVVDDRTSGKRAYASLNEGLGKVLRFGANGPEVLERLAFMRDELRPFLNELVERAGGVDVKPIVSQALQMGDECHNRNKAASALLLRELVPHVPALDFAPEIVQRCLSFVASNEHFFLNLSMAAAKVTMDAARDVRYSTVVTAMTRNGTDFGISVSGLGETWFTAAADDVDGLYFPGYGPEDANPDMGDSTITETSGIGGFAMAGAIPIVKFVGGTSDDAIQFTRSMYTITVAENTAYGLPPLNFRGTPTGIDIRRVIERDERPVLNTGIAHREAGVGQIGAGVARAPHGCFARALEAFVKKYTPVSEEHQ